MKNSYLLSVFLILFSFSGMAQPLNESFEGNQFPPQGWEVLDYGSSGRAWSQYSTNPHTGSNSASIGYHSSQAHNDWLITRELVIFPTDTLHFYARNNSSTYQDQFHLKLSNSGDGTDTADFTVTLDTNITPPTTWTKYSYPLGTYAGQTVRVAFQAISKDELRLSIDDVSGPLTIPFTCFTPYAMDANITDTSAVLSWQDSSANATDYAYKLFEVGNTTAVFQGNTSDTFLNFSGLMPNTDYNLEIFTNCTGADTTSDEMSFNFTTNCITYATFADSFDNTATGALPDCWSSIEVGNSFTDIEAYTSTGPIGTKHLRFYNSSITGSNLNLTALSPELTTLAAGTHRINMMVKGSSSTSKFVVGTIASAMDTASFTPVDTIDLTSTYTVYRKEITHANHNYVAIKYLSNTNYSSGFIDNFMWEQTPSCLEINTVSLDSTTDSSAAVYWDAVASANSYYYEITELDSTTIIASGTSSDTTETITGLNGNTDYTINVFAVCSATDTSASTTMNFTTECGTVNSFSENFDSYASAIVPDCWANVINSTSTSARAYTYSSTSPNSGNRHIRLYNSADIDAQIYFITPELNDLPNGTHRARFFAKETGPGNTGVILGTMTSPSDTASFTVVDTVMLTATYTEYSVNYDQTTTHKFLAIKYLTDDDYCSVYIDDFNWETIPACVKPDSLMISAIGTDSMTFSWTPETAAGTYEVEYGETGFTQGSGTFVTSTDTFKTVTGLNDGTTYDFYVRAICGAGDTSLWTSEVSGTTLCNTISAITNESFEGVANGEGLTKCWSEYEDIASSSSFYGVHKYATSSAYDSSNVMRLRTSYSTSDTAILISPEFDHNLTNKSVKFYSRGSSASKLEIGTMSDPNDASTFQVYTTLDDFTTSTTEEYNAYIVDAANTDRYLAFRLTATATYSYVYIDYLTVEDAPSCVGPVSYTASTVSDTSFEVSWTNVTAATSWIVEYGNVGFTPGTGTTITTTSNPLTITGFMDGDTVDVYVRSLCSATDTSALDDPFTYTLSCAPMSVLDEDFSTFLPDCWDKYSGALTTNSTLAPVTSSFTGWRNDGYLNSGSTGAARVNIWSTGTDEWLVSPSVNLEANHAKVLKFDAGVTQYNSTNAPTGGQMGPDDRVVILISPDNGATWSSANAIYTFDTLNAPTTTGSSYTVDLTAYTGNVKIAFYAESTVAGGDRDFFIDNVEIREPEVDGGLLNFANTDTLLCEGNPIYVSANVTNVGDTALHAYDIKLNISGGSSMTYSLNTMVPKGDTVLLNLDTLNLAAGTYTLEAIMSAADDKDLGNDTITHTVTVEALPMVNAGNDTTICPGGSVQLFATGNANSYSWQSTGFTGGNGVSVGPLITTEYIVVATSAAGCETKDTLVVTVATVPNLSIAYAGGVLTASSGFTSYEWKFNNAVVNTTSSFSPTVNGDYTVTATTAEGCTETATYKVSGIGLDELDENEIAIYPNPVNDVLNINSELEVTNLRIVDAQGRTIMENILTSKGSIEVSELASGNYFLIGESEKGNFVRRFVKK
ncbi:MAG: choice-of-anchor J domain-containing protein [Flavobacteriales bacterium]|jgi:hypothetical protein|nr:choice-of-anchor J domain-containing protein [Flavobacteriales bacterium]